MIQLTNTLWKPGIYEDIPFEEYLLIPAVSKSKLVNALESPLHYLHGLSADDEETEAKRKGAALDTMIFEGEDVFRSKYITKPATYINDKGEEKKWNGNSDKCKAYIANAIAKGKKLISDKEMNHINAMYVEFNDNEDIREFFHDVNIKKQVTLIWEDPDTGLLCKGRPDWISYFSKFKVINDLKSTKNLSQEKFEKDMYEYSYHIQGAFYSDGFSILSDGEDCGFQFAAIENKSPYDSRLFPLGEKSKAFGRKQYKLALKRIKEANDTGDWHGYYPRKTTVDIPSWAMRKIAKEIEE